MVPSSGGGGAAFLGALPGFAGLPALVAGAGVDGPRAAPLEPPPDAALAKSSRSLMGGVPVGSRFFEASSVQRPLKRPHRANGGRVGVNQRVATLAVRPGIAKTLC